MLDFKNKHIKIFTNYTIFMITINISIIFFLKELAFYHNLHVVSCCFQACLHCHDDVEYYLKINRSI